ncbi:hypothetical protein [Sphingomonas sp. URHD0057]|uniref:hypothetical protein n=1 Tax=Sphingomonas sp. URHD0057 TaxID=1380389 RepID=UPI00048C6E09|nr:hypothetical protein [Sphingomonas sp. URHD0057]
MQRVNLKADTLDQENRRFSQAVLREPVFLNSVPKSGSHLLRNIVRMFVPVSQQYQRQFVQFANLEEHRDAFNAELPMVSWGHLPFSDESAMDLTGVRKILLVRDPCSWVIARARFFVSDEFSGNLDLLKEGRLSAEELMNLMIFGIYQRAPSLNEIYTHNAIAWLGTGVHLVRYEDLVGHLKRIAAPEAEAYFGALLEACGVALPGDWRERVQVGSDRAQSGTARENLSTATNLEFPAELPATQRALVEVAAPGFRSLLGYD